jgi:hypothetical protein
MKTTIATALFATILFSDAQADSRIERLCGAAHLNEVASQEDVRPNPAGYFVTSLAEQVSEGDPRIVLSYDPDFHLCTQSAGTPNMDTSQALRFLGKRKVLYLFVPIREWTDRHSS